MASQQIKDFVQKCMDTSEAKTGIKLTYEAFLDVVKAQLLVIGLEEPKSQKEYFFKDVEKYLIAKCISQNLN